MKLIIATGSNLGDKKENLNTAKRELSKLFSFIAESKIFTSPAVDYLNQPDFYNQVLEFDLPKMNPGEVMRKILMIEESLGRNRTIPKGPRIIDIDIVFWGVEKIDLPHLTVPHPSWSERSFVVLPLMQLPYFQILKNHFIIPQSFNNTANPIK